MNRALKVRPLDLARDRHEAGELAEAEMLYRAALARRGDDPEALRLLALLLHETGRDTEARPLIERAAALRPADSGTLDLLGVVLRACGEAEAAVAALRRAAELGDGEFAPFFNLGNALHALERDDEAMAAYRAALRLAPERAQIWNNLGDVHFAREAAGEAVLCYRAATRLDPAAGQFHFNLAQAHRLADDKLAAAAAYDRAAALAPDNVVIRHHQGQLHKQLGNLDAAVLAFAAAVRAQPEEAGLKNDLAGVLQNLGRFDEAEILLREVAAANPDAPAVLSNLGQLIADTGRLTEAEALYRRALEIAPDFPGARYNLCMSLLAQGRWGEGFADYDVRWQAIGWSPRFATPPWRGEGDLATRILVHEDQGLGDFVNLCRLVPAAAQRARILLQVPRPLRRLMQTMAGDFETVHPEDYTDRAGPEYDYQCPMMDLPAALGLADEALTAGVPYLAADPALTAAWRARLAGLPGRKVGLVWAGNPDYPNDRARSLPFDVLLPLADVPGVTFISLQKGGADWTRRSPESSERLGLIDWSDEFGDFADTAALIAALDLLITVDTSVAHVAGAIGAPVWMLNRTDTDWRWGHEGASSAWYPTMRLFRQSVARQWRSVIDEVRAALSAG